MTAPIPACETESTAPQKDSEWKYKQCCKPYSVTSDCGEPTDASDLFSHQRDNQTAMCAITTSTTAESSSTTQCELSTPEKQQQTTAMEGKNIYIHAFDRPFYPKSL